MNNNELNYYLKLASVGSIDASLKLSSYYINIDKNKAFDFLIRLKDIDNAEIKRKIGYFYQEGIGVSQNDEKAIEFYQQGMDLGDASCSYNIALILYNNKNYFEAIKFLSFGASQNHLQSLKLLAEFYEKGLGIKEDKIIALNLYKKIYDLDNKKTSFNIGLIYYSLEDYQNSYNYFIIALNQNDFRSCYYLCVFYMLGLYVTKNNEKALYYLDIGVQNNVQQCIKQKILCYEKGVLVKQNFVLADQLRSKLMQM